MAEILDGVLGFIDSAMSIVQFGESLFAPPPPTASSTVRICVGLNGQNGQGLQDADGDVPDVRLWNEAGSQVGSKSGKGSIKSGAFTDITINQGNSDQATYTLFTAHNNAICVAYSTITWADSSQYGWQGDWGAQCGGTWYYSNIYVNGNTTTKCLWIDGNGDQPQTGFQVHWPDFSQANGNDPMNRTIDYYCNNPPFKMYTGSSPTTVSTFPMQGTKVKRTPTAQEEGNSPPSHVVYARHNGTKPTTTNGTHTGNSTSQFNKRLIKTGFLEHNAEELCKSLTSWGPDLVNLHELDMRFCRMVDKMLFPVCNATFSNDCFNADSQQLIVGGNAARDVTYEHVEEWGLDGSSK